MLADPATCGIVNSAQWQQMIGTLQRVEQEAVSSQSLANAIESIGRTRTEAIAGRLRLKEGERLYPKSWSGSTPIGGFAREVAAWLGYIDPAHEAGKLIQRSRRERFERRRRGLTVAIESHGLEDHSDGAMASIGRRPCAQVVERPGRSAAACTCDAQELQGREGAEGKAHSVVTESG